MRRYVSPLSICLVLVLIPSLGQATQLCEYDGVPATAPASQFTDNGDGTVTDTVTSLQWKRCSEGQTWDGTTCTGTASNYTWQQALQAADAATYAGQSDWRLPNVKELVSIVERACVSPAIDLSVFPGIPEGSFHWSSSPVTFTTGYFWGVYFRLGEVNYLPGSFAYVATSVRLVRAGSDSGPLNDTGISSWADDSNFTLSAEPIDYPGQDASFGRDVSQDNDLDGHAGFSFRKVGGDGSLLSTSASSWNCVYDEVTGLTWEVKTNDSGLRDKDWTYSWYNSDPATNGGLPGSEDGTDNCFDPGRCDTEKYVADVNTAELCGATDWRLPSQNELRSIIDFEKFAPVSDSDWFPYMLAKWYWSSAPHLLYSGSALSAFAFAVDFTVGTDAVDAQSSSQPVRLVRGGAVPQDPLPIAIRVAEPTGVAVRSGPSMSDSIVTEIAFDQEFVAFERDQQGDDTWYKIYLPCGNTGICSGWVPGTYQGSTYSEAALASTQLEVVNTAPLGLNIRALPNGSVLDSAYDAQRFVTFESQTVTGSGCNSPWYRIHLPQTSYAESGWLCGDYAQLVGGEQGAVLSLAGTVTRDGLEIASVDLALAGNTAANASSAGNGAYVFTGLASGSYTITPSLAGHDFSPASRSLTVAGASLTGLDFRACDPSVPLSGYVFDAAANNRPLADVTFDIGGLPVETDANGYYVAGVDCGVHQISVHHGGYEPYDRSVDRFDGAEHDIFLTTPSYALDPNRGSSGDPVDTATGNYVYQRRDLEIAGIGLPLRFDRAYNSRVASEPDAVPAPLGYGWSHSYQARKSEKPDGTIRITWGDGRTETFSPDGSGGYTPQYGVFDTLTDNGDGTFSLEKRDRTVYDFDTGGRLAAITDKNGNTLALAYSGANLTGITDTAGRLITLDYDPSGRITQITDPIGRTVQYAYDANGDLIEATDPNGNVTAYTYDAEHQILTVVDPRGNTIVSNTYDAANRVVTYQTDAKGNPTYYSYQELDRVTTITDALDGVTVHHHDELLRLVKEEDARGGASLYVYDDRGNRTQVTDKNGNVTQYQYDERGNVIQKTDALGNVTEITYDAGDNPLTRTDALDNVTEFAYDANGNLIETTDALDQVSTITYDSRGLPLTVTDPLSNVTSNTFDAEGNLTEVTDALGNATSYTFDAVGRRLTATDALGRVTSYSYDANDNLLSVTDSLGNSVTHSYDANDNKTGTTDRLGRTTTRVFDEKDLLVSEADALVNAVTYTYDALDRRLSRTDRHGNTTQYAYDAVGNLIETTDPLGNITAFTYDLNGNRLSRTDARGHTTTTSYDALNRRIRVKDALGNAVLTDYDALGRETRITDPGGRVTEHVYDALGRRTQTTDPAGGITQLAYDANGNRISRTDANGHTTTFTYDALNRVTAVTDPLGHTTQTTYDAVGNRLAVTDALGHTRQIGYDALNRPVSRTDALGHTETTGYDAEGNVLASTDANGQTTSFAYDALDRLTQVTDAAGGTVLYAYDENGNRLSMTDPNGNVTTYAYDALNRRTTMTEPLGHVTSLVYDAVGNLIEKTDPKGQVIGYTYDVLNRRAGIDYPSDPDVTFGYDAVGNLLSMTDGLGTTTHTYDLLDRRTSTTDPFGQVVGYGYDAVGNRTSLTYPGAKTVTYAFDAADRLATVTDWLGNVTTYSYDDANRLIGTVNANGTTADYTYDAADRLTSLANAKSDGTVINAYSYTLDPVGNHLSEERTEPLSPAVPAETVTDSHDAENRLMTSNGVANSFDANGNMTAKGSDSYVYDQANRLVETQIGGTVTEYQYDALGNRYSRNRDGIETRFVLDTNTSLTSVLIDTDSAGTPLAYNVYGQGLISRILADESVLTYHFDSRGSTIAITVASENVVQRYAYSPFGGLADSDGSSANTFRFLGRYGVLDDGGDLNYLRARFFKTVEGRFLTKDSWFGLDDDPRTLNRYSYSLNNPIKLIDINGNSPELAFVALAGATVNYLVKGSMHVIEQARGCDWLGEVCEFERVGWEEHAGIMIGGAAKGIAATKSGLPGAVGAVATGTLGGGVETLATQGLEVLSGKREEVRKSDVRNSMAEGALWGLAFSGSSLSTDASGVQFLAETLKGKLGKAVVKDASKLVWDYWGQQPTTHDDVRVYSQSYREPLQLMDYPHIPEISEVLGKPLKVNKQ